MIQIEKIVAEGNSLTGMKAEIPNAPPLLLIIGEKGIVMCGYLNIEAAERLGLAAAVVSGVKSLDDVLKAQIKSATTKGRDLGLDPGKVVKTVLGRIA